MLPLSILLVFRLRHCVQVYTYVVTYYARADMAGTLVWYVPGSSAAALSLTGS